MKIGIFAIMSCTFLINANALDSSAHATLNHGDLNKRSVDTTRFNYLIETQFTPWDSTKSYNEKNPFKFDSTTIKPFVFCRKGIYHRVIQITSASASPKYDKDREFTAFCDNASMEFPTPGYNGGPFSDGYGVESVFINLSGGQLTMLGKCKELKLVLGSSEFTIPFANRGAWRILGQAFDE